MALYPTNHDPPFDITRLSHVRLTSTDLERTRDFYESGLGLEVTESSSTHLYLRAIEESGHHSLVFEKTGGAAAVKRMGMRVASDEDIERAAHCFAAEGRPYELAEVEFQGPTLLTVDGAGAPIEFTSWMIQQENRLQRFHSHSSGKRVYLDQFQAVTHNVSVTHRFYSDLVFRKSENAARDGSGELRGVWMVRKNNTHDVVYSRGTGPRLHHRPITRRRSPAQSVALTTFDRPAS